jgi:hypothetical protein
VTLRGARKRDHPQSFSYHEPWWDAYHASAGYFARLSVALSSGQQVNDVLLIEPTTTAWMYSAAGTNPAELEALGESFQGLVVALEAAQVEYDLGAEDILARHGSVQGRALRVGRRDYHTVVLPPMTENLNGATAALIEQFLKAGGTVLACAPPPSRIDGAVSDRGAALARHAGWKTVAVTQVPAALAAQAEPGFRLTRTPGDRGILFHHRRRLDDGELLFLVNTSLEFRSSGSIASPARGVEQWDPATGITRAYEFETTDHGARIRFELPPAGSLLLFLSAGRRASAPATAKTESVIPPASAPAARRVGPNVLVVDYLDVRAGGETREKTYFYQAAQFAFAKNGMERNPWDSAVQFKDELISRTFPPASGVEATYRFVVKDRAPGKLTAVVERPDLYTISCNGKPVEPEKGGWWLDRAFGRLDITQAVRAGENELVLKASPFTIYHELEPVYVLGDFTLEASESGFVIAPDREMRLDPWNAQGQPFYSQGVAYSETFQVPRHEGEYRVQLNRWYGSVASVRVNGQAAGLILSSPWSVDVSRWIQPGANTIEVTVIGTLKNTLGPHHGNPPLGTAWPSMFQKGPSPGPPPGSQYSTVGYGLFEPFVLVRTTSR